MHRFIIISRTQAVVALSLVSLLLALPLQAQDPNLIDVTTFAQLDAMRHDLDGDGRPSSADETAWKAAFTSLSAATVDNDDSTRDPLSTYMGYELTMNLDFAGTLWAEGATGSEAVSGGWVPIGNNGLINSSDPPYDPNSPRRRYIAIFEGNGYTISNLYINRSTNYVGLFGSLGSEGEVRNLGIVGGSVTGGEDVGGLVGYNESGTIERCYATGNVTGEDVGGLVGNNENGTIEKCYATGNVTGDYYIGGLVGESENGKIIACYATGSAIGDFSTGGLVGHSVGSEIIACYATGNATITTESAAGGLVGSSTDSKIIACYATGNAISIPGGGSIGGLVGESHGNSVITACYAIGNAIFPPGGSSGHRGGLVGSNEVTSTVTNSYFDYNISNRPDTDDHSQTTAELQTPTVYGSGTDIYADWNIDLDDADVDGFLTTGGDDPWNFGTTTQYPALQVDFDGIDGASVAEFGQQRITKFSATDYSLSVAFNAVATDVVGTAHATPADYSQTLTYTIMSQKKNDGATTTSDFDFDFSNVGVISVKDPLPAFTLGDVYVLEVKVDDSAGGTATTEVRIEVVLPRIIMGDGDVMVCDAIFLDPGGDGNYDTDLYVTMTLAPLVATNKVQIEFTSFNTYDGYLDIYNGATKNPNKLVGEYSGTTLPPTITSTSLDGKLTFEFLSDDEENTAPGWEAMISCVPPVTGFVDDSYTFYLRPGAAADEEVGTVYTNVSDPSYTLSYEITSQKKNDNDDATSNFDFSSVGVISVADPAPTFTLGDVYVLEVEVDDGYVTDIAEVRIEVRFPTLTMSGGDVTACGRIFLDPGGDGDYGNLEDVTMTLAPEIDTEKVQIEFTSFNIEFCCDKLYIYDGATVASELVGEYRGTNLPSAITSTSSDGKLTFRFTSDDTVVLPGWEATVSCVPPVPEFVEDSYTFYLPPGAAADAEVVGTVDASIATPANSLSYEITSQTLEGSTVDVSTPPAFRIVDEDRSGEDVGVISVVGSASTFTLGDVYVLEVEVSGVAGGTATTEVRIEVRFPSLTMSDGDVTACERTFLDPGGDENYDDLEDVTMTLAPEIDTEKVRIEFTSFNTETQDKLYIYHGATVDPNELVGEYSGTTLPSAATSTSLDGKLTFHFTSDDSNVLSGWEATVSCVPVPEFVEDSYTFYLRPGVAADAEVGTVYASVSDPSYILSYEITSQTLGGSIVSAFSIATENQGGINVGVISVVGSAPTFTLGDVYVLGVKVIDDAGVTATAEVRIEVNFPPLIMSAGEVTACGWTFLDPGGDGDYSHNEDITMILAPEMTTDKVRIEFTAFNTETQDKLYIYDGATVDPNKLVGEYSGTTLPPTITSTSSDGKLTFHFTSDASNVLSGWEATVSCVPVPEFVEDGYTFSLELGAAADAEVGTVDASVSDPSYTLSYEITSQTLGGSIVSAFSIATEDQGGINVGVISVADLAPTFTAGDIYTLEVQVSGDAGGTATTEVSIEIHSSFVMRSGEFTFCSGTFLDPGGDEYYNVSEDVTMTLAPEVVTEKVRIEFTAFDTENIWDKLYIYNGATKDPSELVGKYSGTNLPSAITSTSLDGKLTFRFDSDFQSVRSGWEATVSCVPPVTKFVDDSYTLYLPPGAAVDAKVGTVYADASDPGYTLSYRIASQTLEGSTVDVSTPPVFSIATEDQGDFKVGVISVVDPTFTFTLGDVYVLEVEVDDDHVTATAEVRIEVRFPSLTMSDGEVMTCGRTFLDPGGDGDYSHDEDITMTLEPEIDTEKVQIEFTAFNTETQDKLYIYHGATVDPNKLVGTYNGTTLPSAITSTSSDGKLTFRFTSSPFNVFSGWEATISCVPPVTGFVDDSYTFYLRPGAAANAEVGTVYTNVSDPSYTLSYEITSQKKNDDAYYYYFRFRF